MKTSFKVWAAIQAVTALATGAAAYNVISEMKDTPWSLPKAISLNTSVGVKSVNLFKQYHSNGMRIGGI